MAKKQTGFFWHVHHEVLLEWCFSYDDRANHIKKSKPRNEQATRFRLFQPIKGELPKEVINASQALNKAWKTYIKTTGKTYIRAWQIFSLARDVYHEALEKNRAKIEELHKKECPNCPWDGHTIFPN